MDIEKLEVVAKAWLDSARAEVGSEAHRMAAMFLAMFDAAMGTGEMPDMPDDACSAHSDPVADSPAHEDPPEEPANNPPVVEPNDPATVDPATTDSATQPAKTRRST